MKLIYGTPYIHTPTGVVERRERTLKETLLTNIMAGEILSKALDIALRKTPHPKPQKCAFEMHYGRQRNTEISKMLNIDKMRNNEKFYFSKTRYPTVYSFNGPGGASDQLPMEQKIETEGNYQHQRTSNRKRLEHLQEGGRS